MMKLKTFPHGIHPPEHKNLTKDKPLEPLPPPKKVFIPLSQHFGKPAEPLVQKGDQVLLGQKVGRRQGLFSACVHSSVSGKVTKIEDYPHPLGRPVPAIIISSDGEDTPHPDLKGAEDPFSLKPEEIRERVDEAGIVGMGGAAFPTAVKLAPPKDKPIDTVIINGCECEPVLSSDYRVMLESAEDVLKGAELIRMAAGAGKLYIGIEDNKKDLYDLFLEKSREISCEVVLLKTKYPQGAEKNLIQAVLGRKVPRGGLPFDVGVVVQNVGTAKAVWVAAAKGTPLYQRAVTVSGWGIQQPKNLLIRIGTPFQHAIDHCGGVKEGSNVLIMGGPMMGLAQWTSDVPVIKGTSGILAWEEKQLPAEFTCIRCGRCVEHCPMRLAPTQLMKYTQYNLTDEAEQWGIMDCVECGCCQYSCPAHIPLVHWMRLGKNIIAGKKRKKSSS